jgi:hypothetical protein
MTINERWLQFGYINAKGKPTKTALKIPFHIDLEIDQDFSVIILDKTYTFTCVSFEPLTNNDGTVDITYLVITNNQ